jgi:hypothetical protein
MSGGMVAAGSAQLGLFSGTTVAWPQLASFAVLPTNLHPYAMSLLLVPVAVAAYAAYACVDSSDRYGLWPTVRVAFTAAVCAGVVALGLAYATAGGILGASDGAWDHLGADLMCAGFLAAEVFVGVVLGLWLAGRELRRESNPDQIRESLAGRLQRLIKRDSAGE